ncbi:tetratricopeptide repeat protein [Maribellus maritimus]|uniref:tetratricopeptide repeat protein n=1 Tax=Maribellus maritimus TaxID=2870838 RepID=UPI001EEC8323|nr:tetratricopeptide repeat protein [Maribellus maritimus]MCG6189079.1 tetratricopeptide repeat protein [Maribellus maritimus]
MRYIAILFIFIFTLQDAFGQQLQQKEKTDAQLAITYYNSRDYEKAIPLLLSVYKKSSNNYYFRLYINSLLQLDRFAEAEESLTSEIKKSKNPSPELVVFLGYVLDEQGRSEEATIKYQDAIRSIPPNKGSYLVTANTFLQWGKYDYTVETYLKGRQEIQGEQFNYELARAYLYQRNYDNMLEEYLNLLRQDEKQLARVQSSLSSAMRLDIDDGLRNQFRGQVLKRIQADPNVIGYNRLLIWFFLQEKKFSSALRQSIALDKRTGKEDPQIAQLGQLALNNKSYGDAQKAYEYLLAKGKENPYYNRAFSQQVHVNYLQFINGSKEDIEKGKEIASQYNSVLNYLGYDVASLNMIQEYAHLLAFYLNDSEKAIGVLQKGLEIPKLKPEQSGLLKTEMADIYVYSGDQWEATLVYSQVIDANKMNTLGDEVKLKKAKLAYYMGNFSWAKAQLDVLKASTSKLTANDALDLSLLIGNNLNMDTTAVPLTMFAKADLLFFQNKPEDAMAVLNGLQEVYPYNSLVDDILFRKAKIEIERQEYEKAAAYLEQIVTDFSYDILADDALFELAGLFNYHLGEKEKARDFYKKMLFDYPGSVFVDESRTIYRELREIYPDEEIDQKPTEEDLFMQPVNPNEIN